MVESDEEQLEVLKNWWKENGQSIVIAIALAFFGIFGLQAWNEKVKNTGENASAIYQQILDLNVQSTKEKDQAIFDLSGKLKEEYGNSIYAVLSSLITSKKHIESNDFELGIQQLRWALSQDHGDSMEDLIRVRLARVLASSNKSDEAFLILENYIFFQVGNLASAREAYQKAIANRRDDQSLALLELKLADIPLQKNLTEYVDQAINEAEDSY